MGKYPPLVHRPGLSTDHPPGRKRSFTGRWARGGGTFNTPPPLSKDRPLVGPLLGISLVHLPEGSPAGGAPSVTRGSDRWISHNFFALHTTPLCPPPRRLASAVNFQSWPP